MLDTKLKNNKIEKVIMTLGAIFCVGIAALTMVWNYPNIREYGEKYELNFFDSYAMSKELAQANYVLYYNTLNANSLEYIAPSEVLIEEENSKYENMDIFYQINRFDNYVNTYNKYTLTSYKNLEFIAINTENGLNERNNASNIKLLENGEVDLTTLDTQKYQFYLVLHFDEMGKMTIQSAYGTDDIYFQERMMDKVDDIFNCRYFEMAPIKNMTYVYGVPKELVHDDVISRGIYWSKNSSYTGAIGGILLGISVIMLIIGLLIPSSKARAIIGVKTITRIPLEGIVFGGVCSIVAVIGLVQNVLAELIRTGTIGFFEGMGFSSGYMMQMTYLIWLVVFAIVLTLGIILRYIGHYGIIKYLKEMSIIGRVISWILRQIKRLVISCGEIDFREKNTKTLLKIVLCNAVVLSIIAVTWVFGLIGVVAYSIVLFVFIKRKMNKISDQYNKLLEATQKIAEGNLDVKIEEDLGVFEAFKENLESIQDGFKKAVDEEVKSQKMKTELISNVSHDLKTPLTSIITYIDLLKDENLPSDKEAQYLETLERKAERLKVLIEDLFEVSKATSGNIVINKETVDIVSLMKQTLLELEDKIDEANLVVKKNFPEGKVTALLDSQRMFRVFENLVLNMTKYAMTGSRVYIDIVEAEETIEIIFKNMAAEEIHFNVDAIVERFVRGDVSRHTEGAGLGLAIAKSFVELHGGKLVVSVDGDLFKVTIQLDKQIHQLP